MLSRHEDDLSPQSCTEIKLSGAISPFLHTTSQLTQGKIYLRDIDYLQGCSVSIYFPRPFPNSLNELISSKFVSSYRNFARLLSLLIA